MIQVFESDRSCVVFVAMLALLATIPACKGEVTAFTDPRSSMYICSPVIQDTYVVTEEESSGLGVNSNFGSTQHVVVADGRGVTADREGHMRFDLPSLPAGAEVVDARMEAWIEDAVARDQDQLQEARIRAQLYLGATWGENVLTFANGDLYLPNEIVDFFLIAVQRGRVTSEDFSEILNQRMTSQPISVGLQLTIQDPREMLDAVICRSRDFSPGADKVSGYAPRLRLSIAYDEESTLFDHLGESGIVYNEDSTQERWRYFKGDEPPLEWSMK